jgi:pseudaminic acid cytidylyltransferase
MKVVAIIPARGGSKRVHRKNIRVFHGKPIIAYSIDAAQDSGVFDEIMVSTDDDEIAAIAKTCGASVPFRRTREASRDEAGTTEVVVEVLSNYEAQGLHFELFCCLSATAPFVNAAYLEQAYEVLVEDSLIESVTLVTPFSYPIQRALSIRDGRFSMVWPENYSKRSQELEVMYHDCGLFDFVRLDAFSMQKRLFCNHAHAIIIPSSECQDIDTELDFKLAELKYQLLHPERFRRGQQE